MTEPHEDAPEASSESSPESAPAPRSAPMPEPISEPAPAPVPESMPESSSATEEGPGEAPDPLVDGGETPASAQAAAAGMDREETLPPSVPGRDEATASANYAAGVADGEAPRPRPHPAAVAAGGGGQASWNAVSTEEGAVQSDRFWMHLASSLPHLFWILIDLAGGYGAVTLAYYLSPLYPAEDSLLNPVVTGTAAVHALLLVALAHVARLYDGAIFIELRRMASRALVVSLLAALLTAIIFYFVRYRPIGRFVLVFMLLGSAMVMLLPRLVVWRIRTRHPRRVLLIGETALIQKIATVLDAQFADQYGIFGYWHPQTARIHTWIKHPVLRGDLPAICKKHGIDEIVLPTDSHDLRMFFFSAVQCVAYNCRIQYAENFYEELLGRVPVENVRPAWLLSSGWDTTNHMRSGLKRVTDLALGLSVFLLTIPIMVAAAIAVKLTSKGPVFYTQTRVGRYGRPFTMYKFRSMRTDAEANGAVWAQAADPRRTPIGPILRKTRIDELPQLFNIIRGDMSFVGPRPERPEFVPELEEKIPYYAYRHLVRPGLTGWAQINYPYGASVEDSRNKLEYDLYYVRNYSVALDVYTVVCTLGAVMKGAR